MVKSKSSNSIFNTKHLQVNKDYLASLVPLGTFSGIDTGNSRQFVVQLGINLFSKQFEALVAQKELRDVDMRVSTRVAIRETVSRAFGEEATVDSRALTLALRVDNWTDGS